MFLLPFHFVSLRESATCFQVPAPRSATDTSSARHVPTDCSLAPVWPLQAPAPATQLQCHPAPTCERGASVSGPPGLVFAPRVPACGRVDTKSKHQCSRRSSGGCHRRNRRCRWCRPAVRSAAHAGSPAPRLVHAALTPGAPTHRRNTRTGPA